MTKRPNFLVIVADDLGWSDLSPFGGEIKTPNLQKLAKEGTLFTDFHTASACSPTRSMLLSGTDNHIAGLGQMGEVVLGHLDKFAGKPGYEGFLNQRVAALPEILKEAGYFTCMSGKWHLGVKPGQWPCNRGFEKSFVCLPSGGNHFAHEPGTKEKPAVFFLPPLYSRDDKWVDIDDLKDFYSSDYFADTLIEQLKEEKENEERPFFAFLPFTAPHWPLQAPREYIDKYKGMYDEGPKVLREKRLEAQRKLNLLDDNVEAAPMQNLGEAEWEAMTDKQRAKSARSMEIFAAMVEVMDLAIGRVMDHLKQSGELDNTFVLFMSDNGAEGVIMEALPVLQMKGDNRLINNSLENMGNKDSFCWYGPHWAQAATAPSRLVKGYITEGGIRCPMIIRKPGLVKDDTVSHEFTTVMDILPTILDLAGVKHPGTQFQGREVVLPRGLSWVNYFKNGASVHSDTNFVGWELFGQRAVRRGNYKAVFFPNEDNTNEWELYDLSSDKGELKDIAKEHPEILDELVAYWAIYESEAGIVLPEDGFSIGYGPGRAFKHG